MQAAKAFIGFTFVALLVHAQQGGRSSFQFLNHPGNAKVSGIGGNNVSVLDSDVNMFFFNPALLNSKMDKVASVSYNRFFADIWNSHTAYAFNTPKWGMFSAGLQYTEFGRAFAADETGQITGEMFSNEYAIVVGKSHSIGNYTLGANLKFAHSQIAGFNAAMLLTDWGAVYKHPDRDFTVGLTAKNIGFVLNNYSPSSSISAPLNVLLGFTYKLEHMPLRFSTTLQNLNRPLQAYDNPFNIIGYDINGNPIIERVSIGDKIFRHVIIGGEFILAKGFHIRAGYNYQRRREMRMANYSALSGFSLGGMLKVKAFEMGYTVAMYHPVGPRHFLTLLLHVGDFTK